MDKEFKERVMTLREAQSALADATANYISIAKRLEEAESLLPNLEEKTRGAENEKGKVLEAFALGSVTQADLDRARKALDKARREEAEAEELIEAMKQIKSNYKMLDSLMLKNQVGSAEKAVWLDIKDEEVLKVRGVNGRNLVRAYTAQLTAGLGSDWRAFLEEVFGQSPTPVEVSEFQAFLAKEYGIE